MLTYFITCYGRIAVICLFQQKPDGKQDKQNTVQYRSLDISNHGKTKDNSAGATDNVDYTKDKDVVAKDMVPEDANDTGKAATRPDTFELFV